MRSEGSWISLTRKVEMEARACELLEVADHGPDASAQAIVVLAAHELTRVEACPVVKGSRRVEPGRGCVCISTSTCSPLSSSRRRSSAATLVVDVLRREVEIGHLDQADRLGGRQYGAHEREEDAGSRCPEQHFESQIQLPDQCVPPMPSSHLATRAIGNGGAAIKQCRHVRCRC